MQDLEWQLSNLKLSKKLKELGVKQESLWWHRSPTPSHGRDWWNIETCQDSHAKENYSAFTVAELGEMLPDILKENNQELQITKVSFSKKPWCVSYYDKIEKMYIHQPAETEANARAKMIIYLIENKLIKIC